MSSSSTTAEETASSSSGSSDRIEERFRVDRRKLESLMTPLAGETACPLDRFFAKIEQQTGAQIAWPSKLKVGAKSKRDPQVKISGSAASVQLAKALVLSHCSRKYSKLTLRIDVPHTEHGQLIGRHGALQKEIKLRTGTDIHFPDSNKSSAASSAASSTADAAGKSNQVSLNGLCGPQPAGMEAARRVVRAKQPVTLLLQLPHPAPDPAACAPVRQICAAYDVTVGRQHPLDADAAGGVGWTIRGLAENAEGLARAVEALSVCVTGLLPPWQTTQPQQPPLVRCRLDFERRHAAAVRERMQAGLQPPSPSAAAATVGDPNFFKAALKQFGVRRFDLTDSGVVMWEAGGCRALLSLRRFVLSCLPAYLCFDMPCNAFAFEDSAIESLRGSTVEGVAVDFVVRRGGGGNGGGGARAVTLRTHEGNVHSLYRLLNRLFATPLPEPPTPPPPPPRTQPAPPQPPPPPQQQQKQPQPQQPLSHDSRAPGAEYSRRKLEAFRIMSHRPSGDRFPTSHWSGRYFSRSWAPTAVAETAAMAETAATAETAAEASTASSDVAAAASAAFAQSCHQQQLQLSFNASSADAGVDALLRLLGDNQLTDCAEAMVRNEIDLQTFLQLSDEDLPTLGLPYATRQKLHQLIRSIRLQSAGAASRLG